MTQPRRFLCSGAFLGLLLVSVLPSVSHAGTWVAFQNSYTRGTGTPVAVTNTFALLNPNTQYTLKAFNGGLQNDTTELVSNSVVYLNGAQVVGPANFNQSVAEVNVTIFPGLSNTLSVQVRGKPGGLLTIQVIGVDNDPPTITASLSPAPNAAGWNNSPVTVTFTCSDKTSGVASCPAPVPVSTEGANQVVSGTTTDLAGNTASTSVTVNLDIAPPTITGSINPSPDAGGYNSGPVTVTFSCADALSGVASCPSPVTFNNEGPNQIANGNAVDVAGNTASTTVTVNISFNYFKIRSWQTNRGGDPSQTGKCLDYAPFIGGAVFLNDCANAHPIRVVDIGPTPDTARTGSGGMPLTHEVMLFAANFVIGIGNPQTIDYGYGPSTTVTAPTEYQLELQYPFGSLRGAGTTSPANQIFRLDGDSIILEGSHVELQPDTILPVPVVVPGPCINGGGVGVNGNLINPTQPCSPPPPQLVIQVQNARGTSGSPLVASVRNLSDNEFWDFLATDGSGRFPTGGFVPVTTDVDLWNAACKKPFVRRLLYNPPYIYDPGQPDDGTLLNYAPCAEFNAGWGTVIVLGPQANSGDGCTDDTGATIGPCIDLTSYLTLVLHAGVTVRGNRRGTNLGPQLHKAGVAFTNIMLEVQGDYARVAGLRLRGGSRSADSNQPGETAIQVDFPGSAAGPLFPLSTTTQFIAAIDHNDVSDWPATAITALGPYRNNPDGSCSYPYGAPVNPCSDTITLVDPMTGAVIVPPTEVADVPETLNNVHVARNFVHHNEENDVGYGVSTGGGGRAFIEGNVFDWNRHSIASDAEPHDEYRAAYNLVLSNSSPSDDQDFDMHGSGCPIGHCGYGGRAGFYVDIVGNTFLATDRANYWLRGTPGFNTDFHHNASVRKKGDATAIHTCFPFLCTEDSSIIQISADNLFADSSTPYTDPTERLGPGSLGVGDFDGDDDDDLFLATGVAWYYAPAGAREWRYLNAAPDTIDQLLLGDFDGDGRTDVVAMRGGQLVVSWGGISAFEVLNQSPCANGVPNPCPTSIQNMVVGDFDGDGKPDIFYTDKVHWYISYGGTMPFAQVNDSSFLVQDLRFGHFAICGTGTETDVFSVQNTGWYVSCGATTPWQPLGVSLTKAVDGLVVADFDGDGVADVATASSDGWQISYGSSHPWTDVPQPPFGASSGSFAFFDLAAVGHFKGQPQTDILVWNGPYFLPFTSVTEFWLSAAGVSVATPYSTQDMR